MAGERIAQWEPDYAVHTREAMAISIVPEMHDAWHTIVQFCRSKMNMTLLGEAGAGKTTLARARHIMRAFMLDPQADLRTINRGFVALNTSSFNDHTMQSELFGHVKGSFTGAANGKDGMIKTAETLLLDEIGTASPQLQALIMELCDARKYRPLGSSEYLDFKGAICVATNAHLNKEVQAGHFRSDLASRLQDCVIKVPSYTDLSSESKRSVVVAAQQQVRLALWERDMLHIEIEISDDAMQHLIYDYYGSTRSLGKVLQNAAIRSTDPKANAKETMYAVITKPTLLQGIESTTFDLSTKNDPLKRDIAYWDFPLNMREARRINVERALLRSGGNQSLAAQQLGVSRNTLVRWMEEDNTMDIHTADTEVEPREDA